MRPLGPSGQRWATLLSTASLRRSEAERFNTSTARSGGASVNSRVAPNHRATRGRSDTRKQISALASSSKDSLMAATISGRRSHFATLIV